MSGTEHGVRFMPVADSYKNRLEFRSLVRCTTMAGDAYDAHIGKVVILRRASQTSDIIIRWHKDEETIGK